jgi:hypothetical protein
VQPVSIRPNKTKRKVNNPIDLILTFVISFAPKGTDHQQEYTAEDAVVPQLGAAIVDRDPLDNGTL